MRSAVALALLSTYSVAALPTEPNGHETKPLPLACLVVDTVVTALHDAPSASPFCSSFLGIQTSTVSTTTTSTIYITDTETTVTGTNTITAPTITLPTVTLPTVTAPTATITETADAATVTTCLSTVAPQKRHIGTTAKTIPSVPTPACLKNLLSAEVSLACSCLNVPTPTSTSTIIQTVYPTSTVISDIAASATVTPFETPYYTPVVTPSTTVTVTPTSTLDYCPTTTPDTSCNNQGVQWAYYQNPFGVNEDGDYSTFDPTYFKTDTPTISGVAGSAGGISGQCSSSSSTFDFYSYPENCNFIAIDYRGYLYASQTGTFTFSISAADDIVLVWVGPDAYSGWDRANALLDVTYPEVGVGGGGGVPLTATYLATYGEYIPLRILFAQGDGPFGFNVVVTAPDGTVILDEYSSESEYLVQYACQEGLAPAYAPFGQET